MKRTGSFIVLGVLFLFAFSIVASATGMGMRTVTGKVTGVDDNGRGIAVTAMAGGVEMVAGAIVTDATRITVKGKKASISDIRTGDRVTMTYAYEKDDLYAKKIMKK